MRRRRLGRVPRAPPRSTSHPGGCLMLKPYCSDSYTVQLVVSMGGALGDDVTVASDVADVAVVWVGDVLADG